MLNNFNELIDEYSVCSSNSKVAIEKGKRFEIDSNEYYNVLSVTDDSIYVDLFSSDDGYFISKCDLNLKNCIKLDMPDKNIVSVYFK